MACRRISGRSSSIGENLVLHGTAGAVGFAGAVNETAAKTAQRTDADGHAIDFDFTLDGTTLPLIEQLLGPGAPPILQRKAL